jgi:peptidase M48-like protein
MQLFKIRPYTFVLLALLVLSLMLFNVTYMKERHVSNAHVQAIYNQLAINAGQQDIPPLIILDSKQINAWTDGNTVTITTGILKAFENDDQMALVMAHEIAHAINHDIMHTDIDQATVEAHADKLGAFIMMRAGFDICKGRHIFAVFKRLFGDTSLAQDHPSMAYRLDQLDLPQCHIF